jgi:hypothetical protein
MQILRAFHFDPLRSDNPSRLPGGSTEPAPGIATGNSGAANCQRQLAARNQAAAILVGQICVICHRAPRVTRCARLYHQPSAVIIPFYPYIHHYEIQKKL